MSKASELIVQFDARVKVSREYAKWLSNRPLTFAQRVIRAVAKGLKKPV